MKTALGDPDALSPTVPFVAASGSWRLILLPQAVEQALSLVESADALIEGNRPGVMERLGLGPADCAKRNPRLVYGRMTGWGRTVHSRRSRATTSIILRSAESCRSLPATASRRVSRRQFSATEAARSASPLA